MSPTCPAPSAPQATLMREELHAQHARSLQDKDVLRKQVRELSEKVDELQLQLFQREGQLLAMEGKLRRQQLDVLILVGLPRGPLRARPWVRARAPPRWGWGEGCGHVGAGVSSEAAEPQGGAARGPWTFLSPSSLRKAGSSPSPPGGLLQGRAPWAGRVARSSQAQVGGASLAGGPDQDPTPCPGVARFPHSLLMDPYSVTAELRPGGLLTQEFPGGKCTSAGRARAGFTGRSGPWPPPDHSLIRKALGA